MSKKVNNDERITKLLESIEKKKKELGQRPRVAYITNGSFAVENGLVNINTLTSVGQITTHVAEFLTKQHFLQEAEKLLGVVASELTPINDYLHDLKLRFEVLNWEAKNKQLKLMEADLKKLVSEDTRTAMLIDEIEKLL